MKVLVFGCGGVGSIYAWILIQSGAEVTCVCRSNYTAVSEHGISIDSAIFGKVSCKPAVVQTVADSKSYGPFDYVLNCAKNFPGEAKLIAAAVSEHTAIVLCQNGLDTELEYQNEYPNNTLISGVVYLPTTQVSPGQIQMGPLQLIQIGTYPANAPAAAKKAAQTFATLFAKGGGTIQLHDDVQPQRWIKLAVNAAWNPLCALTRCDDANLLRSSPAASDMMEDVMREVASVAAASGYPGAVSEEEIQKQMARPKSRMENGLGKEPSMLTDVWEGRKLEVDAILGNVLKRARKLGVDVPRLEMIYVLASALSFSIQKPEGEWKPIT
jgi:2-dehydropantoate 2-reductase